MHNLTQKESKPIWCQSTSSITYIEHIFHSYRFRRKQSTFESQDYTKTEYALKWELDSGHHRQDGFRSPRVQMHESSSMALYFHSSLQMNHLDFMYLIMAAKVVVLDKKQVTISRNLV